MIRKILATTIRVLRQLKHDPRTIALVLLLPTMIVMILEFVFAEAGQVYDRVAPLVLVIMAFTVMAIVTSVATLRERETGTFERLMSLPIGKFDILLGYSLAFGLLSLFQSAIAVTVIFGVFDVTIVGNVLNVLLVAITAGLSGMAFGLLMSEFATTEFQAVQMFPAFVAPQVLISGLFVPREQMADGLQRLADFVPITYAVDGIEAAVSQAGLSADLLNNILILAAFGFGALVLGALTMRRQS